MISLSAKGTNGVMKRDPFRLCLSFYDILYSGVLAHYRTRGGEWRG